MPEYHGRDLRKGRFSEAKRVYHITMVTNNRAPILAKMRTARILVRCLRELETEVFATTFAYVIMPDHVHWLFQLEQSSVAKVVNLFKGRSARQLGLAGLAVAPIWQRGFHDHAVRTHENLRAVGRYIVANPLRAKLVNKIGDYPWWDAVWVDQKFTLD